MNLIKKLWFKQVAMVVAFAVLIIGAVPAKSMAYMVDTSAVVAESSRAADMANIQRILEEKVVSEKLTQAGLTMTEIRSKLGQLSDQEVHQFSKQIDSLYPGGDALGVVIALLIIVILVMVILKLSDKKIIIR